MTRRHALLSSSLLLGFAALLSAILAACREQVRPRFPHRVHLSGIVCGVPGKPECLTCNSCHAVSELERTHNLPSAALCETCHKSDARVVSATLSVLPERPFGEIRIDHDRHLAMSSINGQCLPCHAGVVRPGESTMPAMNRCFSCHEHEQQWQNAECAPCHQRRDLEQTLPRTFLRHDASFLRRHGNLTPSEAQLCQTCHTQRDCQVCHDLSQNLTPEFRKPERLEAHFVHRGDFLSRHALEAQSAPTRCASCHAPETCDGCHVARGVSGNARATRNPHPPGWVSNAKGPHNLHGREARRDVYLCASCHDQGPATNCIRCHKVGAYGGNPHPNGFRSARDPNAEMCRYCHE